MSEYIKLDAGAISSKDLRKAKTALNKAISAMTEVDNALSNSWYKYNTAGASPFFGDDIKINAGTIGRSLEDFKKKLDKYAGLLDSGPEVIIEADRDFKGQKSTAWQRTIIAIGGGIGGLFKGGGNKSGSEVYIDGGDERYENQEPCTEEKSASAEVNLSSFSDENGNRNSVREGEVRYVDQSWGKESANGWEQYADTANWSCLTACISMALSYIGIDMSPADLLNAHNGDRYWCGFKSGEKDVFGSTNNTTDAAGAKNILDDMLENMNDGSYSPVVIHYKSDLGEHALLVVGQNTDGSYNVIDPWNYQGTKRITITESGQLVSDLGYGISHDRDYNNNPHTMYIDGIWQYKK